jgi:hypothetical protein
MVGREFLEKEMAGVFLQPPKIAWILDSYGHTAATPELLQ